MTENNLRTRRLFRDNDRALVVAMDHPRVFDTVTGLKEANTVIKAVLDAGADAILAPFGTASKATKVLGNGGLWMSVDTTPQTVAPIVESALRLGVDGIKVEMYPWCSPENDFFARYCGTETTLNTVCLAAECHKWGLPLMVETIPYGWLAADKRTSENIGAAARVASEAGADYVKSFYTGNKESFRNVVLNCSVPVLILGGPKVDSDLEVLTMVRDALDAGAVGITMGRNIWGHENISGMTAALSTIIHDDASVETAKKLLG
jgi:DhnA family fructose-bisphosphate aldolase class Ia